MHHGLYRQDAWCLNAKLVMYLSSVKTFNGQQLISNCPIFMDDIFDLEWTLTKTLNNLDNQKQHYLCRHVSFCWGFLMGLMPNKTIKDLKLLWKPIQPRWVTHWHCLHPDELPLGLLFHNLQLEIKNQLFNNSRAQSPLLSFCSYESGRSFGNVSPQ